MTTKRRRKGSSGRWIAEHEKDPYVRRAREQGWRSRAAFKLEELDQALHLLRPGMCVVDLGAAPGGWSQYVKKKVRNGRVVAMDLLPMGSLEGVDFIQGDFLDPAVQAQLESLLGEAPADLVISDMAPNISGVGAADQARSVLLIEMALAFATKQLKPGGGLLVKAFQGEGFDEVKQAIADKFSKVVIKKPPASRARSKEMYMYGAGKR